MCPDLINWTYRKLLLIAQVYDHILYIGIDILPQHSVDLSYTLHQMGNHLPHKALIHLHLVHEYSIISLINEIRNGFFTLKNSFLYANIPLELPYES